MHIVDVMEPSIEHPEGRWCNITGNFQRLRRELHGQFGYNIREQITCGGDAVRLNLGAEAGAGYLEFVELGPDLTVILADATFRQDQSFKLRGEDWLRFHFRIKLDNSLVFGKSQQFDLSGPLGQLLLLPGDIPHTDWMAGGQSMRWISIYCKRNTLIDTLGFEADQLPGSLAKYSAGGDMDFSIDHARFPAAAFDAINSLFSMPVAGSMKTLYIRSRILEMLCLFLEGQARPDNNQDTISVADRDRLFEARHIIENNPEESLSMRMLSKQVALNRNKLSNGFKTLFGTNVFEFQRQIRLEHAWNLLTSNRLPISQVSLAAGYNHQSTFATAFKKYYGISPKEARSKMFNSDH